MDKIVLIEESIDKRRVKSLATKDAEEFFKKVTIKAIAAEAEDLCADLRDVKTVVAVASETWSGEHDSFVGVLDLIDCKLAEIERAAQSIMSRTTVKS
ncbi:MAG: hypothetical protein ABL970_00930 [Nitrospira sp.]